MNSFLMNRKIVMQQDEKKIFILATKFVMAMCLVTLYHHVTTTIKQNAES